MNKTLVVYHANCVDGFASAAIAWSKLGGERGGNIEYLPYQYGDKVNPEYYRDKDVYLLDVNLNENLSPEKVLLIATICRKFVWLDHHKDSVDNWLGSETEKSFETNFKDTLPKKYIRITPHESGAMIAWKYFHKLEKIPHWIKLVDDYDRWVFKFPETRYFNSGVRAKEKWEFQWFMGLSTRAEWTGLCKAGEILYEKQVLDVKATVAANAMPCKIEVDGKVFLGTAANCPAALTSDVGTAMAAENNTFGLCWRFDKKGKVICGIRSQGKYDVARIANMLGGGGHLNAAGFATTIEKLMSWVYHV